MVGRKNEFELLGCACFQVRIGCISGDEYPNLEGQPCARPMLQCLQRDSEPACSKSPHNGSDHAAFVSLVLATFL